MPPDPLAELTRLQQQEERAVESMKRGVTGRLYVQASAARPYAAVTPTAMSNAAFSGLG